MPREEAAPPGPAETAGPAATPAATTRFRPQYRGFHNPTDICTAMLAALPADQLTLDHLLEVAPETWDCGMVLEAVLNLQSLGALYVVPGTGRIRMLTPLPDAAPSRQSEARYDREPVAVAPSDGPPQVSILSLFAGMGTDRLALEGILRQEGMRSRLGPSWFVESDQQLRTAVARHWAAMRAEDPATAPYSPLCEDVWQLLDPSHPACATLARGIPAGALLLVVAGSPCQGLTFGGPTRGRAGVVSTASSPIVAVFAIWHILRVHRPDLDIHVVLENAGSMTPESRQWILQALNISPTLAPTTDAAAWSGFARRRTFFSTMPVGEVPTLIRPRPPPWDPGWGRRNPAPMPTMMRSRGPHQRASTYQYMAPHLLYRSDANWNMVPDRCLHAEVRRLLPPELRQAWNLLAVNPQGREAERQTEPAAIWLAHHGADVGARPPNVIERSRASGTYELCQGLLAQGLTLQEMFDAQGNAFDPDAFRSRVQAPLLGWLRGRPLPSADLMSPLALRRHYDQMVERVSADPELRPHIAVTPGPPWVWNDFCTSFAAHGAAPPR